MKNAQFKAISIAGALAGVMFAATDAHALINVDVFGGQRTATSGADVEEPLVYSGTEYGLGVHLSPFMLLPVSFGISAMAYSYDEVTITEKNMFTSAEAAAYDASGTYKMAGMNYGPVVTIWAPIPWIQPFLRVGYMLGTETKSIDVNASTTVNSNDIALGLKGDIISSISGTNIGVGLRYSRSRFFGMSLEYAILNQTETVQSTTGGGAITVNDVPTDTMDLAAKGDTETSGSRMIRLGLQVGI